MNLLVFVLKHVRSIIVWFPCRLSDSIASAGLLDPARYAPQLNTPPKIAKLAPPMESPQLDDSQENSFFTQLQDAAGTSQRAARQLEAETLQTQTDEEISESDVALLASGLDNSITSVGSQDQSLDLTTQNTCTTAKSKADRLLERISTSSPAGEPSGRKTRISPGIVPSAQFSPKKHATSIFNLARTSRESFRRKSSGVVGLPQQNIGLTEPPPRQSMSEPGPMT